MSTDATIEVLGPDDVGGLTALAASRGWGTVPTRWALTLGHTSVWGIRGSGDGELVGSVSLYEPSGGPAVIGAMLVAEDRERQGLGAALLRTAIDAAPPVASITLFATPFGEPLYRREGFVDGEVMHLHQGPGPQGGPGARSRGITVGPPTSDAVARLAALDATGAGDRTPLLAALAAIPGCLLAETTSCSAAGLAWPHGDVWSLGPIVADADPDALGLVAVLASAAKAAGAAELRLDAAADQVGIRTWCKSHALPQTRVTVGMALAGPGRPSSAPSRARRTLITQGFG